MKKSFIPVILIFALILMAGCQEDKATETNAAMTGSELHLSDVYTSPFDEVHEVEIVDGTSGETAIISEKDEIQSFLAQLETLKWKEIRTDEEWEGYLWMVKVKSKGEEIQITNFKIGDRYFNSNPQFNEIVSNYLKK